MNSGFSAMSSTTEIDRKTNGVFESPAPRSTAIAIVYRNRNGIARKMIRRYAVAKGSASAGVCMAASSRSATKNPPALTALAMMVKNEALVPTTRRACSRRWAPRYCATRIVAAIDTPNTPASIRNITVFELPVAVSAASPRNLPTQIALTEPLSDCSTLPKRIGSANVSKVRAIGPCVSAAEPGFMNRAYEGGREWYRSGWQASPAGATAARWHGFA